MAGKKFDEGKNRLDLVPPEFIEAVGWVLTFGAKKYGPDNWKEGIETDRIYGATMRHLMAWRRGEKTDSESGLSHLWHVACNLAFLIYFEQKGD
ncbi:MAG: hypothetical protein JRI56_00035 [Deltaproteobacteria bacterium]|nr:hypothetical protein [Deltaproteobacteria bacterium]